MSYELQYRPSVAGGYGATDRGGHRAAAPPRLLTTRLMMLLRAVPLVQFVWAPSSQGGGAAAGAGRGGGRSDPVSVEPQAAPLPARQPPLQL